ncbi:hypothetical protein SAMN05444359_11056 [Neolewinella agarilytica]|uniref:Uncharacterized protein n=1 Tax=Neolewinella agarilytica TaxID=478744 RepID=A0A1H9G690_9BACT|nr:hypothetical protein SAMN05444359_11056 [Neolewinella agarilytica]
MNPFKLFVRDLIRALISPGFGAASSEHEVLRSKKFKRVQ